RLLALVAAVALIGGALGACDGRECPPPSVTLPEGPQTVGWSDGGYGIVPGAVAGHPASLLLNTGFWETALAPLSSPDAGFNPFNVEIALGGATAEGVVAGPLPSTLPFDGIVGAEVLYQLPIAFDARDRTTTVFPEFRQRTAETDFVQMVTSVACLSRSTNTPLGPFALLVHGEVEGTTTYWQIDTGVEASFIRTQLLSQLTDRAQLTNLFLGGFRGTATRAREIKAGLAFSPNALVIASPGMDDLLDARSELFTREAGTRFRAIKIDGLLGWSFLREFAVDLAFGDSAVFNRGLGLARFDTQLHWTREFVGIGINPATSFDPTGIRVLDFWSHSPAQLAGLLPGDVIVKVDGQPVSGGDAINSPDALVDIEVLRRADGAEVPDGGYLLPDGGVMAPMTFQVGYEDLLPNPP
ncbi:MAG TPA: PDZ domain-containing protein, partial [Myxococcaceae bacterium]|nr:PDZ domain-containing protein [Myxococcaceae bacterium]